MGAPPSLRAEVPPSESPPSSPSDAEPEILDRTQPAPITVVGDADAEIRPIPEPTGPVERGEAPSAASTLTESPRLELAPEAGRSTDEEPTIPDERPPLEEPAPPLGAPPLEPPSPVGGGIQPDGSTAEVELSPPPEPAPPEETPTFEPAALLPEETGPPVAGPAALSPGEAEAPEEAPRPLPNPIVNPEPVASEAVEVAIPPPGDVAPSEAAVPSSGVIEAPPSSTERAEADEDLETAPTPLTSPRPSEMAAPPEEPLASETHAEEIVPLPPPAEEGVVSPPEPNAGIERVGPSDVVPPLPRPEIEAKPEAVALPSRAEPPTPEPLAPAAIPSWSPAPVEPAPPPSGVELMIGDSLVTSLDGFLEATAAGHHGVCLVRESPERIRARVGSRPIEVFWLTNIGRGPAIRPSDLEGAWAFLHRKLLDDRVTAFFFEGVEYLVRLHGADAVLTGLVEFDRLARENDARIWLYLAPALMKPDDLERFRSTFGGHSLPS